MKTVSKIGAQVVILYFLLENWTWLQTHLVRGALAITLVLISVQHIIERVWRQVALRKLRENLGKAEAGDLRAQVTLGGTYQCGSNHVRQNYAEAAKWYRKAAEQGDSGAQLPRGARSTPS